MSTDIVEIAVANFTDWPVFEKIATQVMYLEGYMNIRRLGGTHDYGMDAADEAIYQDEVVKQTVFQFTLQESLTAKVNDTIKALRDNGIKFTQLIVVTKRRLTTERKQDLKANCAKLHKIPLQIIDQGDLVIRLSDLTNGILQRCFPDLDAQLDVLRQNFASSVSDIKHIESQLLKIALRYTLHPHAEQLRSDIFDQLILTLLIGAESAKTAEELHGIASNAMHGDLIDSTSIDRVLARLIDTGEIILDGNNCYLASGEALIRMEAADATVEGDFAAFISDLAEHAVWMSNASVDQGNRLRLERNARFILLSVFRDAAAESVERGGMRVDRDEHLLRAACRGVSLELGSILASTVADALASPTAAQQQMLGRYVRAYITSAIMNVDPMVKSVQKDILSQKTVVVDTDALLEMLVIELPQSQAMRRVVSSAINAGLNIVIPERVIREFCRHAEHATGNYRYIGSRLDALNSEFVEVQVTNAFVRGYYYWHESTTDNPISFNEFLRNYFDVGDPEMYVRELIMDCLPSTVLIVKLEDYCDYDDVSLDQTEVAAAFRSRIESRVKSASRTEDEIAALAETDTRLLLSTLAMRTQKGSDGPLLRHAAYILTRSGAFRYVARAFGIDSAFSVRPEVLASLLEYVGGATIEEATLVRFLGSPMLSAICDGMKDGIEAITKEGISVRGKSITRLRADLGGQMHERITRLKELEARGDSGIEEIVEAQLDFYRAATDRDYELDPRVASLAEQLEKERGSREHLEHDFELLEERIETFGRRRRRYLKRFARKGSPD